MQFELMKFLFAVQLLIIFSYSRSNKRRWHYFLFSDVWFLSQKKINLFVTFLMTIVCEYLKIEILLELINVVELLFVKTFT